MSDLYVQYGCGLSAPEGWLNFDASPTLRFERLPGMGRLYTRNAVRFPDTVRYGDIARGLPISPNSCKGIYCSHVLEHLALEECDAAIKHTFIYLKEGGIFRLVVPDLEQLARIYLSKVSEKASHQFMEASGLGRKHRSHGLLGFVKELLGNSAHLWLWDERSMSAKLSEHGFGDIRRVNFGDAEDAKFNEVEAKDRFDGCLAIQCKK